MLSLECSELDSQLFITQHSLLSTSRLSFDDLIRSRQHVGRNRQADLLPPPTEEKIGLLQHFDNYNALQNRRDFNGAGN